MTHSAWFEENSYQLAARHASASPAEQVAIEAELNGRGTPWALGHRVTPEEVRECLLTAPVRSGYTS